MVQMPRGNVFHGEITPDQLFSLRVASSTSMWCKILKALNKRLAITLDHKQASKGHWLLERAQEVHFASYTCTKLIAGIILAIGYCKSIDPVFYPENRQSWSRRRRRGSGGNRRHTAVYLCSSPAPHKPHDERQGKKVDAENYKPDEYSSQHLGKSYCRGDSILPDCANTPPCGRS